MIEPSAYGWEGPCDETPECSPPSSLLTCPSGQCVDVLPEEACQYGAAALSGDPAAIAVFCQPPSCGPSVGVGGAPQRLSYGDDARQVLDLYRPEVSDDAALPVLVWVHGGAWRAGSLDSVPAPILALRRKGVAVVSVEYRLSDTPWPTTVSDVREAIRWLRRHADEHGLDPERIAAAGSSAGGHLVAMLGVADDVAGLDLPGAGPENARVRLVVNLFGPADLLTMDVDAEANGCPEGSLCHDCEGSPETGLVDCEATLQSCEALASLASPVTHVSSDDAPFISVHGERDCTVPTPQSARLHRALLDAGVESALFEIPDAGHNVSAVFTPEVSDAVGAAIDRHLLGCVRQPPDPDEFGDLSACLVESCVELSRVCAADEVCLEIERCVQACFGTQGCIRGCTAEQPDESVDAHRALFMCGNPAGCYTRR